MSNIVIWILVAALGYLLWAFNSLVRLRQRTAGAWSDIDVQLKRRWDLVPSLVSVVKGYASHEASTLDDVVSARNIAAGSTDSDAGVAIRGEHELGLAAAISRLVAVVENYPDLKANTVFLELHAALVDIEDALQSARRYYNAVVRDYNTRIQSFPSNLVAATFRFQEAQFFQIDEESRATPLVRLGTKEE